MKILSKINWLYIAAIPILLTIVNCQEEEANLDPLISFELANAVITEPAQGFTLNLQRANQDAPLRFSWEAAVSEQNFLITYDVLIDFESGDFSDPLLNRPSNGDGVQTSFELTQASLDLLLSSAGIEPNGTVDLKWAVRASSSNQNSMSVSNFTLTRFNVQGPPNELFISGEATESGADLSNALKMNRLMRSDGSETNTFQIYTSLQSGMSYNFFSGTDSEATRYTINGDLIEIGNNAIIAPETGVYRVTVDFETEAFSLFRIDRWSIVGNVIPNGWGGDEPLEYQGNGVWQSTIELIDADPGDANKRFIFRANEDWGQVLKQIPDSSGDLALEGTAESLGFNTINDISVSSLGETLITINLNGDGYFFTLQ